MLKCRDVAALADRYLDGDLPPIKYASLRLHLLMCRHCRNYVDSVQKTITILQSLNSDAKPGGEKAGQNGSVGRQS